MIWYNSIIVYKPRFRWYIGDLKTLGDIAVNIEDGKKPIFNDNKLSDEVHKFVNTIPQQWISESSYEDKKIIIMSWFRGLSNNQYNQPKNVKIEFNKSPLGSDATYIFIPIYNKNWNLMVVNPSSSTVSIYIINNKDDRLENYRDVHGSSIDPSRFKDWKIDRYMFKDFLMDGYSIYYIILISYSIVMGYGINYKHWDIRSLVGQIAVECLKPPELDELSSSFRAASNLLKGDTTTDMRYSMGNERVVPMKTHIKDPHPTKPPKSPDKSPIIGRRPNRIKVENDDADTPTLEEEGSIDKSVDTHDSTQKKNVTIANSELDLMNVTYNDDNKPIKQTLQPSTPVQTTNNRQNDDIVVVQTQMDAQNDDVQSQMGISDVTNAIDELPQNNEPIKQTLQPSTPVQTTNNRQNDNIVVVRSKTQMDTQNDDDQSKTQMDTQNDDDQSKTQMDTQNDDDQSKTQMDTQNDDDQSKTQMDTQNDDDQSKTQMDTTDDTNQTNNDVINDNTASLNKLLQSNDMRPYYKMTYMDDEKPDLKNTDGIMKLPP